MKIILFAFIFFMCGLQAQADTERPYSCVINFKPFGRNSSIVRGPVVLDAAKGETFDETIILKDDDEVETAFRFLFKAHIVTDPNEPALIRSLSETRILSPFDNSILFHSDKTGESIFSPSIGNLVDPNLMNRSKNAFFTYNVNVIKNMTARRIKYNGELIQEIYAACQIGKRI